MAEAKKQDHTKGVHAELAKHLQKYRDERKFDPKGWVQEKCKRFNDYMRRCKLSAAVVSLSGGKVRKCLRLKSVGLSDAGSW